MSNGILTQEEVDALLADVSGEPSADDLADEAPVDGVRPYDLAKQERIVRGRMPTLEIINDRFARMLRLGIFNFMRRSPDVTASPIRVMKFSEFLNSLVVPTNLNIAQLKPLRGNCLFVIDPTLVFLVIDNMFGGSGKFHTRVEGRDFTATEQRIIQRLLDVVFTNYEKSWAPVYPLKFEYIRSEMNTQFANIAGPTEIVVTTSFALDLGGGGGSLHICMPYASLEPIRDLIYNTVQGDNMEPDRRWVGLLSKEVQNAHVNVVAKLAEIGMSIRDVVGMRPGDVLEIDIPDEIITEVDGVPMFACQHGQSRNHYAVKVKRVLADGEKVTAQGEA